MIQVELLRISSDSNYIEFIVACPIGYHFNRLEIRKYDADPADWVDCVSVLQGTSDREVIRLSTSIFSGASMFYCNFGIIKDNWTDGDPDPETLIAVCSDVNKFYFAAHDKIEALEMKEIPRGDYELLTRWYFAVYAHEQAMRLERYDDAERFYDILKDIITESGYAQRELETLNFTERWKDWTI